MENNNSKTNCITKAIKANFCTAITYMLVCIIAVIALFANALLGKNTPKLSAMQLAERQKLSTYAELDENNKKAENCSFVEFSAFFTNDKDNKGNAIKRIGTCKRVNEKDILYIDLNVLTNGYLENGQIVIEGANFVYNANTLEDELIKSIATNENTTTINLNQLTAGTQKLIPGEISLKLNNINDYSNTENKITLTGTHVSNDNVRTAINVTREVTVDWYGETEVNPEVYVYEKEMVYSYNSSEAKTVAVNFAVDEIKEELLLKNNYVEVEIPQLNNIAPESVICVNGGVASEYDAENRILKLTKSSEVDSNGNVTNKLPYSNTYTIAVGYPAMAFEGLEEGTKIDFNIKANYTAYNNPSAEFNGGEEKVVPNNTVTSNQATGVASIVFKNEEKIEGSKINFSVNIVNKLYNDRTKVFGISKEALLQYYTNSDEAQNFKYTVEWDAEIRANTSVDNIKMSEIPAEVLVGETSEGKAYGDKFDENEVDKYVANTGIYFVGATETLGESGKIFIYNNDTNDLIYTFDASNWNTYNAQNPFVYITTANNETVNTPVKHIRIETTAVTNTEQAKVLRVFNIKELDKTLFKNDFTEEDGKAFIQNAQLLYTNIEGTAKYTETTSVGGNETTEEKEITVKAVDSAYLEQKVSFADISIEPKQVSTAKELKNAEIRIATKVENEFDSNWQNGKFIVEIPNEIIGVNVSKVEIESVSQNGSAAPNTSVTIENWEQTNLEDGKHILKISTTNETPATYVIKITADLTADYRIGGGTKEIKLYAYNSLAEIYYNTAKDVYDINGNEATDENIAGATANFEIVSAQELITYDTVTNYTKVSSEETQGESTVDSETLGGDEVLAPNIAEINNEKRQATINVVVENKYNKSIENVCILGRIPFEGNKYILKGDDLNSNFTSQMAREGNQSTELKNELIRVPDELKDKAVVYYSDKEDASKDIDDNANNWKELVDLNLEDIANIKSYLIDLTDSKIDANKKYVFDYDVKVPENVTSGKVAYSNHTVYYDLVTEEGKLEIATEPTKVGIRPMVKYALQIKTYEKDTNIQINEASYKLVWDEIGIDGNTVEKTCNLVTDENGDIKLDNLILDFNYKLQQTTVNKDYIINETLYTFSINGNGVVVTSDEKIYKNFENKVLQLKVENVKKKTFNLKIKKVDPNGNELEGAIFKISSIKDNTVSKSFENHETNNLYIESNNGIIQEYSLEEVTPPVGYSANHSILKFKVYKNESGEYQFEIIDGGDFIKNKDNSAEREVAIEGDTVTISVVNKKLIEFTINKVDSLNGTPLSGARFEIKDINNNTYADYATNTKGQINLLLEAGEYTAIETSAPKYYYNSNTTTNFEVKEEEENEITIKNDRAYILNVEVVDEDTVRTINSNVKGMIRVRNRETGEFTDVDLNAGQGKIKLKAGKYEIYQYGTIATSYEINNMKYEFEVIDQDVNIMISNKKYYTIKKVDENGKPLYGVEFEIHQANDDRTYSSSVRNTVYTNSSGEATISLPEGSYVAIETNNPNSGYVLDEDAAKRSYYFDIEDHEFITEGFAYPNVEMYDDVTYIRTVDDWNEVAGKVNSGVDSYENKRIILLEDLDFVGKTFNSIGTSSSYPFQGNFDGGGHTISNVTCKNLFENIKNSNIYNINFENVNYTQSIHNAGIIGIANNSFIWNIIVQGNTLNMTLKDGAQYPNGGIVGEIYNSTMINCINEREYSIYGGNFGGLVGYAGGTKLFNCENKGNINGNYGMGGICFESEVSRIENCQNSCSVLNSSTAGGIVSTGNTTQIKNCINSAEIKNGGGIVYNGNDIKITNSYNYGNIKGRDVGRNSISII